MSPAPTKAKRTQRRSDIFIAELTRLLASDSAKPTSKQWQIASAVPGRVRVQASNGARRSDLKAIATLISSLDGVLSITELPEARSVVVRYHDPGRGHYVPTATRDLPPRVAPVPLHQLPHGDAPVEPGGILQAHAAPEVVPTRTTRAVTRTDVVANGASTVATTADDSDPEMAREDSCATDKSLSLGCTIGRAVARTPAKVPRIKVREYGHWSPRVRHVAVSSAAFALTAIEAVPIAIMWLALVAASIPVAERMIVAMRRKHHSPDIYDLANIGLSALEGSFLGAGAIAWLISIKDLIRGETLRASHVEMHAAASTTIEESGKRRNSEHALETMLDTVITDSEFQHIWTKTNNTFSLPLTALAIAAFALTRDPGYIIGILRPRADFSSALCFGVPLPMLNAMSRAAMHGPLLKNTEAIEKLAHIDSVVFLTVGSLTDEHQLGRHVRPLMKRGIHRFVLPSETEAEHVRRTAARAGFTTVLAEAIPEKRHDIVERLVRHGHRVAVIDDGNHNAIDLAHADVHVVIASNASIHNAAHMVMSHADLRGFVQAIDASREALQVMRRNTGLAAGAAIINLGMSFVPPVAATAVNTATTALQAINSRHAHMAAAQTQHLDEASLPSGTTADEAIDAPHEGATTLPPTTAGVGA